MKFILIMFLIAFSMINANAKDKANIKYDILYFHATLRCAECMKIEEFTKNTLNFTFEKELKNNKFNFQSLDFLEPENEHFQTDYKFDNQTLIISKKVKGKEVKWKNIDKVWDKLRDFEEFKKYLESEISEFIK